MNINVYNYSIIRQVSIELWVTKRVTPHNVKFKVTVELNEISLTIAERISNVPTS